MHARNMTGVVDIQARRFGRLAGKWRRSSVGIVGINSDSRVSLTFCACRLAGRDQRSRPDGRSASADRLQVVWRDRRRSVGLERRQAWRERGRRRGWRGNAAAGGRNAASAAWRGVAEAKQLQAGQGVQEPGRARAGQRGSKAGKAGVAGRGAVRRSRAWRGLAKSRRDKAKAGRSAMAWQGPERGVAQPGSSFCSSCLAAGVMPAARDGWPAGSTCSLLGCAKCLICPHHMIYSRFGIILHFAPVRPV